MAEPAPTDRAGRVVAVGYDYASQPKEHVRECNLCASTVLAEVSRRDRYGFPATLLACPNCGLAFLSPRLTEAAYGDFYAGIYRQLVSAHHGRLIDADTVQEDQRIYASELAGFLDTVLPSPPSSVIDIGGSTGVVAGVLRDALGAEATVLDPAPDELVVAAQAGMETVAGLVERYDPGGRTWDLVLLCQTIDHLLDVNATLAAIARMMGPHSHAFVDVLDLEFALCRVGQIEAAAKIDHPHYLTRATALAFFTRAGLEVVAERMSDDGHWGFVVRAGRAREPDWGELSRRAELFLADVWTRRARAGA